MAEIEPPFEIDPEMVPIQGFNPLFTTVAPPRQVMMGGNLAQSNVIKGATRKRQRSGLERQHARGTFMQKFDHDCHIIEIIPRFTEFDLNPMDLVIFEHADTGQLDVLKLPRHHILHQHYGYMFERRDDVMDMLHSGARIKAGTIVATSPNVTRDGDYMPGAELNICNLDDPSIAEDALIFSDEVAGEIFQTTGIESRIISCGKSHYPINANGNERIYLPVPEIGQQILPNGLITALRPKNKFLDPIYMSKRKLMNTVYGMDEPCFGKPGATVIDIRVHHNEQVKSNQLPPEMSEQFRRYYEADKEFYRKLLEVTMCRNSKIMSEDVNLSNTLWVIVKQAIDFLGPALLEYGMWPKNDAARLNAPRLWRGHEMDEWLVQITFAYQTTAAIGPKATDLAGSLDSNTIH